MWREGGEIRSGDVEGVYVVDRTTGDGVRKTGSVTDDAGWTTSTPKGLENEILGLSGFGGLEEGP